MSSAITVTNALPQTEKIPEKHVKIFYSFGIVEATLGTLSVILGIVLIALPQRRWGYNYGDSGLRYVGCAFWGGVFLIICGILGILVKSKKSRAVLIANLVLAILTSLAMISGFFLLVIGAIIDVNASFKAIQAILACIFFGCFVLSIVHASYCCCTSGGCCGGYSNNARYGYNATGQQIVQLPNGNVIVLQGQSIAVPQMQMQPGVVVQSQQMPVQYVQSTMPVTTTIPAGFQQQPGAMMQNTPNVMVVNPGAQNNQAQPLPSKVKLQGNAGQTTSSSDPPPLYQYETLTDQ